MNKDFVPFGEALAMRELGFDKPCFASWNFYTNEFNYNASPSTFTSEDGIQLPTFSQAFRWFREKYNIDSWIQPFTLEKANGELYLPDESYSYFIFKDGDFVCDKVDLLDTEEAELACLRKLIEIVKQKGYE